MIGLGGNTPRVWLMYRGIGPWTLTDLDVLKRFASALVDWKCRANVSIFPDGRQAMPDVNQRRDFAFQVVDALASVERDFFFVEVGNEPGLNTANLDPGEADSLCAALRGRGVFIASGNYSPSIVGNSYQLAAGDWLGQHADRKDEWPRGGKDLYDLRDGWGGPPSFAGVQVACVGDEPMGCADQDFPGKRSNVSADFADYAASSALHGMGATFHADNWRPGIGNDESREGGIFCEPLTPTMTKCATAFFDAMTWVDPRCQYEPYMRGGAGADIGPMPIEHADLPDLAGSLRTFAKVVDNVAYAVAIRPGPAWTPRPKNGWTVESEGPTRGLVRLTR